MRYVNKLYSSLNFYMGAKKKIKSRKINKICKYPPTNKTQLIASLLEFLNSKYFNFPVSLSLFKRVYMKMNTNFIAAKNVLENLDFSEAIEWIQNEKGIEIEKTSIGNKANYVITRITKKKIIQLTRQTYNERPKEMPKIEKKNEVRDVIQKQQKTRYFNNIEETNYEANHETTFRSNILSAMDMEEVEELEEEICTFKTRYDCFLDKRDNRCMKRHYYKLLLPNTIESNGFCENEIYEKKCKFAKCKYMHYSLEEKYMSRNLDGIYKTFESEMIFENEALPSQWINCDLRHINYEVLGKFNAIMLDPPWDIHMNLPYSTLKDKEMLALNVEVLQNDGYIFLWVTMRALELGRQCMTKWGYKQVDELVWVKTNSFGKIVRSGRTGHWLNHSKEHCLIGYKGDVSNFNKNLDCDVLVSEVRETSRKPDEIYSLIERIAPGGRKCELFARPHNRRKGWVSLGNQLPGINIVEDDMKVRFKKCYPNVDIQNISIIGKEIDKADPNFLKDVYYNHLN
jgi:mRNA (2'-O-methyladenosine-N6-)-methyltransferase